MDLQYWAATDVGKTRDHNEDNFLIDKEIRLFIVADGMGGHAAGEIASSIAVHELRDTLSQNHDLIERYEKSDPGTRGHEILQIMEHSVQQACSEINRRSKKEADKRGMGTTCTALLVAGPEGKPHGFIAHVGDSRIYLVRQHQTHQLTEDHSLINELIRRGKLKREDAATSPYAKYQNAVTRAVGVYESVEVDTFDFDMLPGDNFLLCSDGLYPYFDDNSIAENMSKENINEIPKTLIDIANHGGGHDNITAICVRVPEGAKDTRAQEVSLKLEILRGMPLFKFLTYKELVHVMNITQPHTYKTGERIFGERQPGDKMFVILSGKVRLQTVDTTIVDLGKGAHFGEMALIDRSPRSLNAIAMEASRMLSIDRKDFYKIVRKEPALSVKLLWSFVQVLAERLRKTTADLSGTKLMGMAEDLSEEVLFDE